MARKRKCQSKKLIKPRCRVPPKVRDDSHTRVMNYEERKKHKETFLKFFNPKTSTPTHTHNKNNEARKKQMKSRRKIVKHTRRKPKHKCEAKKKTIGRVSPNVSGKNCAEGSCSKEILSLTMNDDRSMMQMETFKKFVKHTTPTPRDLRRKLTEEEMIQLCLKVPCRVDLTRWNRLNDFDKHFTCEGRKEGKTKKQYEQLLLKGIKEDKVIYTKKEIREARIQEWAQRKKDNIALLRLWKYEESQKSIEDVIDNLLVPKAETDDSSGSEC